MGKNATISTLPNISQNYLPKINTSGIFANTLVYDDGSSVLINTTTASAFRLDVNGTGRFQGALTGTSATFSSSVTAAGLTVTGTNHDFYVGSTFANTLNFGFNTNTNLGGWVNYTGFQGGTTQFRDFNIGNGKNGVVAFFQGSTGNVGIGTDSPTNFGAGYTTLGINGSTQGGVVDIMVGGSRSLTIAVDGSEPSISSRISGNPIVFRTNNAGTVAERMRIGSDGVVTGNSTIRSKVGFNLFRGDVGRGGMYDYASISGAGTDYSTTIFSETGQGIYFAANGSATRMMTITSGGDFLVGTTTTDVNTQGIQLRNNGIGIFVRSGASCLQLNRLTSDGIIASFRTSDVERGSISISGSTTTYNTSSDYRLKKDFKNFNGLDIVGAIKAYDFAWKENDSRMYGVIAHELQEVLGYAVVGDKDGEQMQQVDYSKLTPILIKAIQELNQKITLLENK